LSPEPRSRALGTAVERRQDRIAAIADCPGPTTGILTVSRMASSAGSEKQPTIPAFAPSASAFCIPCKRCGASVTRSRSLSIEG
jgi:hypothetical protein